METPSLRPDRTNAFSVTPGPYYGPHSYSDVSKKIDLGPTESVYLSVPRPGGVVTFPLSHLLNFDKRLNRIELQLGEIKSAIEELS